MKVRVTVFGSFRDHLPEGASGNNALIEVSEGASVADVAAGLAISPQAVYAALLDGEPAGTESPVKEGSEVTLMPPFSGGADSDGE